MTETETGVWVIAGWKEGVARMLSQSATYILEMQKSLFQLHGQGHSLTTTQWIVAFQRGVGQSSLSAGLVYGLYYNVYHTCMKGVGVGVGTGMHALEANAVATFITSLVKIPISNAIRCIQLNPTVPYTLPSAIRHIYTKSRWTGLYSGYGLSFVEDFIEMAIRDALFMRIDGINARHGSLLRSHEIGFVGGALSGAVVAYLTTPFDTLRCHLTYLHSRGAMVAGIFSPMHATRQLIADHGIGLFYRGARTRAISTGLRMAFFYTFMKICS
jgi:hypothetical protein